MLTITITYKDKPFKKYVFSSKTKRKGDFWKKNKRRIENLCFAKALLELDPFITVTK